MKVRILIMSFFYHELKNHINRDPLSDWFEIMNKGSGCFKKDSKNSFQVKLEKSKEEYKVKLIENLKDHDLFYENLVHEQIKTKMENKEKFIASYPSLYNKKLNIRVKPDLILHREAFMKYFPEVRVNLPEYIIVDILYKNLHFNADKTDILNNGSIYYHKCKMYVAYSSLGLKGKGYFFGKEYRHKGVVFPKKNR